MNSIVNWMVTTSHSKEHTGRSQAVLEMCVHAEMCVGVSKLYTEGGGELRVARNESCGHQEHGELSRHSTKSTGLPCRALTNLGSMSMAVSVHLSKLLC